jgi:hypothetical protein
MNSDVLKEKLITKFSTWRLGKGVVNSVIAEKGTFLKYRRYRLRQKTLNQEFSKSKTQLRTFMEVCLKSVSQVTEPLALISQIQRSGGSLLSQLFDGHPELHAHPYELKIGFPKKYIWPSLDPKDSPERWFEMLFEDVVIQQYKEGYRKSEKEDKTFPFIFLPSLQRQIFLNQVSAAESISLRDIFNAYMTSYFGAWLNNQNNYGPKKIITSFTPRMAMKRQSMESFFEIYPDGKLISIVRDPKNWYPSAIRHATKRNKYDDRQQALKQWSEGARATVWNKEKYGNRVCIIRFEDLVSKTDSVMRHLAEFLNIKFDNILLTPTFNKSPIKANTSFQQEKYGMMTSTLSRYKTLTEKELEIIDEMTDDDYQAALSRAVEF